MKYSVNTIILKCISKCNLACDYCSAHCASQLPRSLDPDWAFAVFRDLLKEKRVTDRCKILWHGGEAVLYDPLKADKLMADMRQSAQTAGVELAFIMQSNGFCISEQWFKLIEKYQIAMGISLDGPPEIHDVHRHTAANTGSYANVVQNIEKLLAANIRVSLLSVIDERHKGAAEQFFKWYTSWGLPIKLNPFFAPDMGQVAFENYVEFLKQIYILLLDSNDDFSIEPFGGFLKELLWGKGVTECCYTGNCGKTIICLDYDGQISVCSRLAEERGCFIKSDSSMAVENADALADIAAQKVRERQNLLNCRECRYFNLCHGGCSAYLTDGNAPYYCAAMQKFFRFLENDGLKLLKQRLLREKQELLQLKKNQLSMLETLKNERS